METTITSHKNALEIIEHPNFNKVFNEIMDVLRACPVIQFKDKAITKNAKGKTIGNANLDIAQPIMNLFLQVHFQKLGWDVHPVVIPEAGLKADFRKQHNKKVFQIEIQFGNMARWYSDIFKFQLASIVGQTDIGICIVPMKEFADRIDSNVAHYERCVRELPQIQSLLHLPILVIGVYPDKKTEHVDLDSFGFEILKSETDRKAIYTDLKKGDYLKRIVQAIISKSDFSTINESTPLALNVDVVEDESTEL